jgi:hypothetical protein
MQGIACVVDWPGAMSFLKDLIVALAAIVTASAAWKGLNRWKLEQTGKVHFEVARQLARATYKFRNAMNDARSVFTSGAEFPEGYSQADHTHEQEAEAWAHVFNNRFNPLRDAALELQTIGLEAEVLWGDDVKQKVGALLQTVGMLRGSMEEYVRRIARRNQIGPENVDRYLRVDDRVFGSTEFTDVENEFTEQVKTALSNMQDLLKAHLAKFRLDG